MNAWKTVYVHKSNACNKKYNVRNCLSYSKKFCNYICMILRGIVHVVSGFPQHFTLYRGNLDCFSNSVRIFIEHWEKWHKFKRIQVSGDHFLVLVSNFVPNSIMRFAKSPQSLNNEHFLTMNVVWHFKFLGFF